MKLSAAIVSTFLSSTVTVLGADLGIDFHQMPVGCQWHLEWSDGKHWIETYLGIKGQFHVIETVQESNPDILVRKSFYTDDGHIVRSDFANGSWQKLAPHSCFTVLGDCEYRFSMDDGTKWQIKSSVKKLGKGKYRSDSFVVGGNSKQHWEEDFTLGPYNLLMSNKAGGEYTKITKIESCTQANS